MSNPRGDHSGWETAAPTLLILIPLEETPKACLLTDTCEDEQRLRSWLRSSSALESLPMIASTLLDFLDEIDEANGRAA